MTYGHGRYVAVGEHGVVISSTDLKTWTAAKSGISSNLTDVHFGNGQFVVVGESGAVLISDDGTTWSRTATESAQDLNAVTYSAAVSLWISVGANGEISSSPDGLAWTTRHTGSAWLSEVAVSDLEILAVEAGGQGEMSSTDGSVWTRHAQPLPGRCGVAWSNGTWVSVDFEGGIHRRPGVASAAVWQTPASGLWTAGSDCDVAAGTDFFVVVDAAEGHLFTSPDGITWTKRFKSKNALRGAVVAGTEVVAVGSSGEVAHAQCPGGACAEFSETQISVADDSHGSESGDEPGGEMASSCGVTLDQCCSNDATLCTVSPATCDECPTGTRKGIICTVGSPCETAGGISVGSRICHCR